MTDEFVRIVRCPYCDHVIGLDSVGIVKPDRVRRVRTMPEGVDYVVFDLDRHSIGPCPHLVLLEVRAHLQDNHKGRQIVIRHPALYAAGRPQGLTDFLLFALPDCLSDLSIVTPFRVFTEVVEGVTALTPRHRGWDWWARMDTLFAENAITFVEECALQSRLAGSAIRPNMAA